MLLSPLSSVYSILFKSTPRPTFELKHPFVLRDKFDEESSEAWKQILRERYRHLADEEVARMLDIYKIAFKNRYISYSATIFIQMLLLVYYFSFYFVLIADPQTGWTR